MRGWRGLLSLLGSLSVVSCPANEASTGGRLLTAADPGGVSRRAAPPVATVAVAPVAASPRTTVDVPRRTDRSDTAAVAASPGPTDSSPEDAEARAVDETSMPADASPPEEPQRLVATARFTRVYERPSFDSRQLGYMRVGAVVRRFGEPHKSRECERGFYQVEPRGYVCVGRAASLHTDHAIVNATSRRPDRDAPLPYEYGQAKTATPFLYTRVPTVEEQKSTEPSWAVYTRRGARSWERLAVAPVPAFLEGHQPSLRFNGTRQSHLMLHEGQSVPGAAFALLTNFEQEGRRFGLTTDMTVVPLDHLQRITASKFHGLPLGPAVSLPVAFVRSSHAWLYRGDFEKRGLRAERKLDFREAVPLSGQRKRFNGKTYLETTTGDWIVDARLTVVPRREETPHWATGNANWIDVSIARQSLVAYVGSDPVYVTLVSTGTGGTDQDDPRATRIGEFRIHTKHVSIGMDGEEEDDAYDIRDVPYVQYFSGGYAFHAAFWHDGFGVPKSHGCVNLSPLDARWLFTWTDPPVPRVWHGAMSLHGTLVSVHE